MISFLVAARQPTFQSEVAAILVLYQDSCPVARPRFATACHDLSINTHNHSHCSYNHSSLRSLRPVVYLDFATLLLLSLQIIFDLSLFQHQVFIEKTPFCAFSTLRPKTFTKSTNETYENSSLCNVEKGSFNLRYACFNE